MHKHLILIILIAFGLGTIVILIGALTPALATDLRFEITSYETEKSTGFLGQFRSLLGIRGPTHPTLEPGTKLIVHASAYAPSKHQTDGTPCITASGARVRRGTVASNFLPLGTILQIDGQLYIVEDRMNPRFKRSVDIFFLSTSEAVEFGRQEVEIEVVGYGEPGQPLTGLLVDEVGEITQVAETAGQEAEELTFFGRIRGRYYYLRRVAAEFIGVRTAQELNRYDVDCLEEVDKE